MGGRGLWGGDRGMGGVGDCGGGRGMGGGGIRGMWWWG